MNKFVLFNDDCLKTLKKIPDNSIDSCVTDPPYGINFMNAKFDYDVPTTEIWQEVLRVLKPGAHLLSFFGTRTYHRGVIRIEDAGFEIRDQIAWIYGVGMPHGQDISKAIDKLEGKEREIIGYKKGQGNIPNDRGKRGLKPNEDVVITKATSENTKIWEGWNTTLKPSLEPIVLARKPLSEKTIVSNVLKYGTGAINIDDCRVEGIKDVPASPRRAPQGTIYGDLSNDPATGSGWDKTIGRYPANVIHDGSEEVIGCFPNAPGQLPPTIENNEKQNNLVYGERKRNGPHHIPRVEENKSASRFFYCAKASKKDRNEGLTDIKNLHITVKPTELMKYLVRLVTPPNGIVLDPFMGSGTTGKATAIENFRFIGIEIDKQYFEVAKERIEYQYNKNE